MLPLRIDVVEPTVVVDVVRNVEEEVDVVELAADDVAAVDE